MMMQSTPSRSTLYAAARLSGRTAIAAAVLLTACLTGIADAARTDQAGQQQARQVQTVVKRVQRLEQVAIRSIERVPDATIRLLDALVARGASGPQLEAIALRGTHKVSVQRRVLEDQVRRYTDGILPTSDLVFLDDDGVLIDPGLNDLNEATITFLRRNRISIELIMEVVEARQSALNSIQDAALIAQARIDAALNAALNP